MSTGKKGGLSSGGRCKYFANKKYDSAHSGFARPDSKYTKAAPQQMTLLHPLHSVSFLFYSLPFITFSTKKSITKTDRHSLCLAVIRQRGLTQFSPDSALLVTTEWQGVMQHVVLIHPDGSGSQGVADSDGGVQAACVDCGGETVGRGVAETDGVVFRLEFGNRADGTEDLLLHYLHVFGHARENGRLDEVALFAVALATDFDFGALFLASVNVTALVSVYLIIASRVETGLAP